MKLHSTIIVIAFIFFLSSCDQKTQKSEAQNQKASEEIKAEPMKPAPDEVKLAINKKTEQLRKAFGEANAKGVGKVFATDATMKFPEKPALQGREGIVKAHEGMLSEGMQIKLNSKEIFVFDDMAYEVGDFEMKSPDGATIGKGDYGTLWKDVEGRWLIYRDIISSTKDNSSKKDSTGSK